MKNNGMTWSAYTLHVDLETGEQLTLSRVKQEHYKKIKTDKHVKTYCKYIKTLKKEEHTHGTIQYTIGYIRNPQSRLFE